MNTEACVTFLYPFVYLPVQSKYVDCGTYVFDISILNFRWILFSNQYYIFIEYSFGIIKCILLFHLYL